MVSLFPSTYVTPLISRARATGRAGKAALFLFSVAVLLAGGTSGALGQSALDGFDPNANGPIYAFAVQPDGKILIGGDFTSLSVNGGAAVGRNNMARLNPDGTLDTDFDPDANDQVISIVVQADGKILVGGRFTTIGGQTRTCIARLDATTGLADSFNPNPASDAETAVNAIALPGDGKILVGGYFTSIGGQARTSIARLDAATGLADSFDANAHGAIYAIVVQADGKILVGGSFAGLYGIGGAVRTGIARLEPSTGLADSFNPMAGGVVFSIALQADGKILAAGYFQNVGGQDRNRIARLDPTTGLADSFNPDADAIVYRIAVQADGKVLAGGVFASIGGQERNRIARLDPTTGLADSFNPNASDELAAIAVQADGKILVGGNFTTLSPNGEATVTRNHIARLETDGRVDQTVDLAIVSTINRTVVVTAAQPDGKFLIGGIFSSVRGVPRNNIARLNSDGTLDTAFNPDANSSVFSISVQAGGKILAGGNFTHIGGQTRNYLARLDATTGLADSFDPNANENVRAITVQADGKIVVCGFFTGIGGQTRNNLARLDPATGLADSFNANANNSVSSIAVQPDGKILVGGFFSSIGGQTRNNLARLDAVTGLADSFAPNPNNGILSIVVQPDDKILTGGAFTAIGGQTRHRIARLDAITGLADSFDPDANGFVSSTAIQGDGKILVGGSFTTIGGETRSYIARLEGATGLPDSFGPGFGSSPVNSIVPQSDGKVLVAGVFKEMGGQPRNLFARLSNDTAALQNLAVTQTSIIWTRGGSSPQFTRVTFEASNDSSNYTLLGDGTAAGSNWTLMDLNLPTGQNFYIRARGYYRTGNSESIAESVRNAFVVGPTPAAQLINVSTRMRVGTGDNIGIGGFIIAGTAPKRVLLRALGPSLTGFGINNVLPDTVLELHGPDGFVTIMNDDWRETQEAEIIGTGIPPVDNRESAIAATLDPGAYTAVVRGKNNTSGVAVVEVYDLSQFGSAKLANLSTRAFVSTGSDIVIAGFILGGNGGKERIVLRGIGPSLAAFGISNALENPTLELRDGNGALLIANNDWQDNPDQAGELAAVGLAPTNPLESGIVARLSPGLYTTLFAGLNNGTGTGLVEVYDLGEP